MDEKELNDMMLNEGRPAIANYVKKKIRKNDYSWARIIGLICLVFIGGVIMIKQDSQKQMDDFKEKMTNKNIVLTDSLQHHIDTLGAIHVVEGKIVK